MIRILIIEKNDITASYVQKAMKALNYEVVRAADANGAYDVLDKAEVHLIIASVLCGGIELTADLRNTGDATPVIMLLEEENRAEKRRTFRSGADGYIVLPLDTEELQMRVKNLLWRCRIVDDAKLRFGNCCLHAESLTIETPNGAVELRRMEFLLLEKLLSYPGRVFTRAQLMDELWGIDSESDPRTVDTHIRRLRKKLREVEDIRLQTVRGLGYRAAMPRRARGGTRTR